MPKIEMIAERQVEVVFADSEPRLATLRIGRPTPHEKEDWECHVAIDGAFQLSRPVFGVDSGQAVMLGIALLKQTVESQISKGARLRWPGTHEPINVNKLFPL